MRKVAAATVALALLSTLPAAAPADSQTGDGRFGGDAAKPAWAPSRDFDLMHVAVALTPDLAKHRIAGEARLTLAPLAAKQLVVRLDAKNLQIAKVALVAGGKVGAKLAWQTIGDKLEVTLPRAFKTAEAFTIVIAYECAPAAGVYFRGPDKDYPKRPRQAWTQGEDTDNSNWVPIWDYPNDRATSELTITAPDDLITVSNGKLLEVKDDKQRHVRTWHWKESVPHATYLLSFVVGDFVKIEDKWKDVPLEYYVGPGHEEMAKLSFSRTAEMMEFMSTVTGVPYPYEKYAQTAVDGFMWGGMENISATTLNDQRLVDPEVKDVRLDGLVAHELAHQWFGDLVTNRDWGNAWLNEGFASFLASLWEEHARGADGLDGDRYDAFSGYAGEDAGKYSRPLVTRVFREATTMFDAHTYGKGELVLFMLRDLLGEERFWAGMHEYLARHARDVVDTHDFIDAMSDASGENLDWFFDQWVFRAGYPHLAASWSWDASAKQVSLSIKQAQLDGDDTATTYRLPITVELWYGATPGGKHERRQLVVDEATETLVVPAASRPKLVLVDPDRELIRSLHWERPVAETLLQLTHPRAAARFEAADALGGAAANATVVNALAKCAAGDKLWRVRQACARALGANGGPGAWEALARTLGAAEKDARVRDAAANALGNWSYKQEPRAAEALAKALASDKSPIVRGDAAAALGRTRAPEAKKLLLDALTVDSYQDEVRQGALGGLGSLADAATLDAVLAYTARGQRPSTRTSALGAALAITARAEEPNRDVRDIAFAMLAEDDYQIQRGVLNALRGSADAAVLDELDRWAEHAPQARLRIYAEDAATAVRDALGARRSRADVARDVEDLKQQNRELKRRLDALEKN